MDRKKFGKNLAAERKRLNLKPNEMAQLCGVKSASQYLYEKGNRVPTAEYLELAFNNGVISSNLFSSTATSTDQIYYEQLVNAFIQTDNDCRDDNGRLLDLEHRLSRFLELIKLSPNTKPTEKRQRDAS